MITWTLTEGVDPHQVFGALPTGVDAEDRYWQVNGESDNPQSPHQDPHDARHFPSRRAALEFLITNKMKRGDTLRYEGADTGRVLTVDYVQRGDFIYYDVGTREIASPAELIDWLDMTVQQGDTVAYLPHTT